MATSKATAAHILDSLGDQSTFSVRPMFGEYALYANGKTVGFICDDTLFIKIVPASSALMERYEQGQPYPGSKPYYVVEEDMYADPDLKEILLAIAASIPAKKRS